MFASTASVEEFEEEAQQAGGQIEVGERDYTVRRLFFLSLC
jgi:hypothetical protein